MSATCNQIIPQYAKFECFLWIFTMLDLGLLIKKKETRTNIYSVSTAFQGLCANFLISSLEKLWKVGIAFRKIESYLCLPYDPAIVLPGIYPKMLKTHIHTHTQTCI